MFSCNTAAPEEAVVAFGVTASSECYKPVDYHRKKIDLENKTSNLANRNGNNGNGGGGNGGASGGGAAGGGGNASGGGNAAEGSRRNGGAAAAGIAVGNVAGGEQGAAAVAGAAEWNPEEIDRFSFDDSDRFEEDSLCSWSSEPESLCNNWRGWKKPSSFGLTNTLANTANSTTAGSAPRKNGGECEVSSLTELAARCVASYIPFELVEHVYPPVPEQLQLRIAFWSFPDNEEDIRLYSCLANSSADEFNRGDQLFKTRAVKDTLQIGFHLSATVVGQTPRAHFNVAVTFDRRRISSCNCTCTSAAYWCSHVVAVCLHRIHNPLEVCLRAPVSESLTRLQRDQLQKFAQYLISELPQQILPTAQRLLDELLSSQPTAINTVCGAPDPTAGASVHDQTSWYLDEKTLHANIKRILIKFCLPAPIVFSDVNYLTNSAPPAAAEWSSLLRPLRGREPEGMWNLLSIVREMYRRCDRNAVRLLEIITEECMVCDQILIWWFQTKLSLMMGSHGHSGGKHSNTHSNSTALQHACSSLCDEIVVLWRLAALNPGLAPDERDMLHAQFTAWHLKILDRVVKCRMMPPSYSNKHQQNSRSDAEMFIGFKPAIEACYLDWEEYPIAGITHTHDTNPIYYSPFTCFKHTDSKTETNGGPLNATQALMANNKHYNYISSSTDHGMHAAAFKQRHERPFRERFYISSSNNSSNSSSDSVHARLHQGLVAAGGVGSANSGATLTADGPSSSGAAMVTLKSVETSGICAESTPSGIGHGGGVPGGGVTITSINGPSAIADLPRLPMSTVSGSVGNSGGGGGGGVVGDGDGNRSSASSEGFCENEDFGGDSSSNNLCAEGGQTLEPAHAAAVGVGGGNMGITMRLEGADSQRGFESLTSMAVNDVAAMGPSVGSSYQTTTSLSFDTSSSTSSSSSNSSSSSMLMGAAGIEPTPEILAKTNSNKAVDVRRMSKEESFSSSSDEFTTQDSPTAVKPAELNSVACTSAAAAVTAASTSAVSASLAASTPSAKQTPVASVLHIEAQPADASSHPVASTSTAVQHTTPVTTDKPHIFSNVRPSEDAWDILLARAEGLHAHGHGQEACILAVRLAEEMLANPPNLMVELPQMPKRKGKHKNINPISHHLTVLASSTLSKCAFLCTVLSENSEHFHIAFRICLFALEMPRPPASTKPLEVKLANQEADILTLLKKIPLNEPELQVIRERAECLRNGTFKSRGEALLPINLSTFIFDALVMPLVTIKEQRNRLMSMMYRMPSDENLGFEAAVAALGLKANVSEAEHPLLCEGTRRQRGELALTLLCYYKDEPRKIAKIMEKLLDREIHVLLKSPLLPAYYSNNPPVRTAASSMSRREEHEYASAMNGGAHNPNVNDMFPSDYGSIGGNSRPHSSTSAELEVGTGTLSVSSSQGGGGGSGTITGAAGSSQTMAGPGGQTGVAGGATSRSKDSRYKGKRAYPSIPNQPSEASAHFMFELAKNLLIKAGGNSSTSLFTQATTNQNHHGPHRALHMCAFQLGLYALGLHNWVSPNWLSRTYSSHVSWILGQAMEIGAPAISFLIDTWEGHLTPPEAAGMADRASRGWDNNMVYPAAELALSVLPHAAALNPNEIQRAILQCKEQSDHMLERACITVENAAKGGGVYPEVLFQVARYWYELYGHNTPNNEHEQHDDHLDHSAVSFSALIESHQHHEMQQQMQAQVQAQQQQQQQSGGMVGPPPVMPTGPPSGPNAPGQPGQVVVTTAPQAFQQGVATLASIGLPPYPPYSFCQNLYHHNITTYPGNQMQMYISAGPPPPVQAYPGYPPPPTQQQNAPSMQPSSAAQPPSPYAHQASAPGGGFPPQMPPQQLPPQAYQAMQCGAVGVPPTGFPPQSGQGGPPHMPPQSMQQAAAAAAAAAAYYAQSPHQQAQQQHPSQAAAAAASVAMAQHQLRQQQQQGVYPPFVQAAQVQQPPVHAAPPQPPVRQRHPHQFTSTQLRYLMAAYNVGMLAMETLARRVHDDRPQAKYARNPPYGEDVKWLLRISKKLGTQYLHQFCVCAVNSIVSPFVLHDVAIESAHYLGRNNHQLVMQHLRSALTPLVQKCQQMYIQCIHQKLYHLTQADYEDFASIILAARAAFQITPEGSAQFKDWLQSIKRSKSCKKELWTQINAALQSNSK